MSNDNVVQFPGRKPKAGPKTETSFEFSTTADSMPAGLPHMFFHDTSCMPALACSPSQRERMWRIWNLCYQIQKSALLVAQSPELAEQLEQHLRALADSLPEPPMNSSR